MTRSLVAPWSSAAPWLCSAAAARAQDFWPHWSDGKAEMNGYRLVAAALRRQPRQGTAVLIYVTEDFSDSLRVKADPGKHPASDVYPVLKLNAVRDFQTGIYDYNVMTSTFARVAPGWPIAKVSFSSQEWCGHVYHQLAPAGGPRSPACFHSYFDGEADGTDDLPHARRRRDGGRGADPRPRLDGRVAGARRDADGPVPAQPPARAASSHRPLAWGEATVTPRGGAVAGDGPGGDVPGRRPGRWPRAGGRTVTYSVEAAPPYPSRALVRRRRGRGRRCSAPTASGTGR